MEKYLVELLVIDAGENNRHEKNVDLVKMNGV
jgi:hypothetical protein